MACNNSDGGMLKFLMIGAEVCEWEKLLCKQWYCCEEDKGFCWDRKYTGVFQLLKCVEAMNSVIKARNV